MGRQANLLQYVLTLGGGHERRLSNPLGVLSQVVSSASAVVTSAAQDAQDFGQKLLQGLNVTASVGLSKACFRVGFEGLAAVTIVKCTPFTKLAKLPQACAYLLGGSCLSLAFAYWGCAFWAPEAGWRKLVVRTLCLGSCVGSLAAWMVSVALLLLAWSLYDLVRNAADVAHGPAWTGCCIILAAAFAHVLLTPFLSWRLWRRILPASTSAASAACPKEANR